MLAQAVSWWYPGLMVVALIGGLLRLGGILVAVVVLIVLVIVAVLKP